mgnify:CR=1 FL=1
MKNKNLVKYLNNLIDTDTHKDIMNGTRRIGLSMDQKQTVYDSININKDPPLPQPLSVQGSRRRSLSALRLSPGRPHATLACPCRLVLRVCRKDWIRHSGVALATARYPGEPL